MRDLFTEARDKAEAQVRIRLPNAARAVLETRRAEYDAFRNAPDEDGPEIVDDPWDAAAPGRPGTAGPWATAAPGPPPPREFVHTPPPAYHAPPARPVRRQPSAVEGMLRLLLVFAILFCGWILLGTLAGLISAVTGDEPEKPPAVKASVPERMAGTWSGTIKDRDGGGTTWKAEFTLRAGATTGQVRYLGGRCVGTAVPVSYRNGGSG
ncbi:MAG TPA: hypothetical protein VHJ17_09545 [Thermomonospora sp.]|nr:hypothetical protein [Thermomonospora sp.]